MRKSKKLVLMSLAALAVLAVGAPYLAHSEERFSPVSIDYQKRQSVTVQAYGQPTLQNVDPESASATIQGIESSQCQVYGRKSDATGLATTKATKRSPLSYTLEINTDVVAHGGHFRTCATCLGNQCLAIHGNDTSATASVMASSTFTIRFDNSVPKPGDYLIEIDSSSSGVPPMISLSDGSGKATSLSPKGSAPPLLHGAPGAIYYLHVDMPASVTNGGGCCSDQKSGKAVVDIRVRKAPLLDAGYATGYIRGGRQTNGYKNVGAILIAGQMQCTGTVVGPRTVMTAAHCLYGYELDKDKFMFVLGSNYQYPVGPPSQIEDWVYPDGTDTTKFKFDITNYEDDIGLLHLKAPVAVERAVLHSGPPTWAEILRDNMSLIFVGFGYNVVESEQVGIGIKREGTWQIDNITNKRISFSVPGRNTCHGDSGGPAFVEIPSGLALAAITSTGDDPCTRGTETRVDAYYTWLDGKIY